MPKFVWSKCFFLYKSCAFNFVIINHSMICVKRWNLTTTATCFLVLISSSTPHWSPTWWVRQHKNNNNKTTTKHQQNNNNKITTKNINKTTTTQKTITTKQQQKHGFDILIEAPLDGWENIKTSTTNYKTTKNINKTTTTKQQQQNINKTTTTTTTTKQRLWYPHWLLIEAPLDGWDSSQILTDNQPQYHQNIVVRNRYEISYEV